MEIRYQRILNAAYSTPWAILPEKLAAILNFLELRAAGMRLSDEEIKAITAQRPAPRGGGQIAVIPVFGTILHRADMLMESNGGTSIQRLKGAFRQAVRDPSIKAIVLDVDSPGGRAEGVSEMANEIFEARQVKKVIAVADTMAASAAYWLASSASEFVVTPDGDVGSIGVFAAHFDESEFLKKEGVKVSLMSAGKFKAEGNPFEPLSAEGREFIQGRVDDSYKMFVSAVARNRRTTQVSVRNGFGQGRLVSAKAALAEGMVDRIATLDETLERLGARRTSVASMWASSETYGLSAEEKQNLAEATFTPPAEEVSEQSDPAERDRGPEPQASKDDLWRRTQHAAG